MARDQKTLKAALNRVKGVDHKLERQKKLAKTAEKRKRQKAAAAAPAEPEDEEDEEEDSGADGSDIEVDEFDDDGNVIAPEEVAAKLAELAEKAKGQADGWETDEEDEDDDDDEEGGMGIALDDESESESEIEEVSRSKSKTTKAKRNGTAAQNDEDEDDEEEDDEDIALSDIESLASEDKADIVPHQRLTINNTAALQRSLKAFALPSSLPFTAVQAVTSENAVAIADVDDDLNRELAFYRQSLDAVTEARRRLKKDGVPFTRPTDYFAEMVKSEEQMGKVRAKLLDETARKKASADARRQRDLKKFGKAVQNAKLQERAKEKRETLDRIQTLKRSELIPLSASVNTTVFFWIMLTTTLLSLQNVKAQTSQPQTRRACSTLRSRTPQSQQTRIGQSAGQRAVPMGRIANVRRRTPNMALAARSASPRVTTRVLRVTLRHTRSAR